MNDEVLERIERYIERHPGASSIEVLAEVGANPTEYRDTVEALLADDVEKDKDPDVDGRKDIRDHPPAWSSWASADFTDPNSGVWPEENDAYEIYFKTTVDTISLIIEVDRSQSRVVIDTPMLSTGDCDIESEWSNTSPGFIAGTYELDATTEIRGDQV